MIHIIIATNIQRFSLHDGPGIRTSIFLKGCTLHCPWCSNPENINPKPETFIKDENEGVYGREYTTNELFDEIMKDRFFYGCNGGVTFSGGEPLLQAEGIIPLLEKIKETRITTAIETCLFVPTFNLECLIPYIDFFYVDMKILDDEKCESIIKGNLQLYRKNLSILCAKKQITIRIPIIGGFTDNEKNLKLIKKEILKHINSIIRIELIKGHNLGESKYRSLGRSVPKYIGVSSELIEQYKKSFEEELNIPVEICSI